MVGALLVALALALLQLSLIVHVRQVLQASAWEGARHASYYNTTLTDGVALTKRLIEQAVGPRFAESVRATQATVAGKPGVTIVVEAPFPAVGLWSPGAALRVTASVADERPG